MLDIRKIREEPEIVKSGIALTGDDPAKIDRVLAIDEERRGIETQSGELRAERNAGSKEIGRLKDDAERETLKIAMREIGDKIAELEVRMKELEVEQRTVMLTIPNIPDPQMPVGKDDRDNQVVRVEGTPRGFDFTPKPHWEIGANLGILDIERGVKISGSRFYVLKGSGAALQRALITWFLDLHVQKHGYTEIYPPFVVKEECLVGTGQLPKFHDHQYRDVEDDLWLVPTAEVPVTNLHRDEILDGADLPIKYVAYTPCFRREKMSAGRDVRGIKRGHQFDKVEMVKLSVPENSDNELMSLLNDAEDVCKALEIPYRLINVCTGDKGFSNVRQFDLELFAPGCGDEPGVGEWLEVSSCSNFTDFQARRANIRFRREAGSKPEFVHTLNGSGLALPRVMIAVLENYQNADGSVTIPTVLRPYLHGLETL
ncbi:MAG: serine--tRNA ligase [Chthonomonadales bacterium]